MPFDPREFLAVAHSLDGGSTPGVEAALRTCRGRAYYSAYLVARERLAAVGIVMPLKHQGGQHQWLLSKLRSSRDDETRRLGKRLTRLYDQRIRADYDLLDCSDYEPKSGHNAAVSAEQWINEFLRLRDDELKKGIPKY
jgi:uncharacterized protein (UPF0332 family)